ncbi:MAG TPA: polymer-forming cytoskeletal protein [Polyangiaceae bacterium]|nr:polymer-forming cytoskeletal protein [Polyangiaceae bacterium]
MAEATAIIGRATRVQGRVTGEGDLDIQGIVRGEVAVGGEVTVDSGGMVDGNVTGRKLVVRGAVKGDLVGRDVVVLEDGARVVGDVRAPRVAVASGALLRGLVEADPGDASRVPTARDHASVRTPSRDATAPSRAASLQARKPAAKEAAHTGPVASHAAGAVSHETLPSVRGPAAHAPQAVHAASSAAQGGATNHAGARRAPPPVLPSLKRARGQIVKKKER